MDNKRIGYCLSNIWILLLGVLLSACGIKETTIISGDDYIPTYMGPEVSYCGEASKTTYSGTTVTIQGDATFQRREPFFTGCGGLGAAGSARPIRYAEVNVKDASGNLVQCTETDGSGHYTFVIPQGTGALTITVNARGNTTNVRAYVYDDPRLNNTYSLSTNLTPDSDKTASTMNATVDGPEVLGGAFNIFDQILEANIYLRAQVGNCSGTFTGCLDFTVAPKVTAYWKPGFNPAEYQGGTSGSSYYLPGYNRIFILGGIDEDVNNSDTDHFDNSVIVHEYGHFLEDNYFTTDSPGGSHSGDKVIDPRLAWSEGWGNFFQAAVRNDPYYVDTEGNVDGQGNNTCAKTSLFFDVDLENQTSGYDTPQNAGEGNFREFSVTRMLWDTIDTNVDTIHAAVDNVSNTFNEIWYSLNSSDGWKKSSAGFKQIGLLHLFQSTFGTNWAPLQTMERHLANSTDYGQYVTNSGSCTYSMSPGVTATDGSDLLYNNDFLYLRITSVQTVTLTLNYSDQNGIGTEANLDLYLYDEDARIGNASDIVASSVHSPDSSAATSETETITKSLSAGKYLINVKANVSGVIGTPVNYELQLNGSDLCPAALP
ncbi:MAG: hypothetical protein K1X29_04235 [Bdellovibrionales bacterium]|nr:hypothetical protein [Bdellovibrionales bacterium]